MARFSIREALSFSFSMYGKHFVLVMCAALLVGSSHQFFKMAPRFVAEKLGAYREIDVAMSVIPQDGQTDQSAAVLQKVQEVTAKISTHIQTTPKHMLGLIFLTWLVSWIFYLGMAFGFMNLALHLKDKGTGSLALMAAVSFRQIMRFVGAFILYILYVICGIIGASILTVPFAMICKGFLGDAITGVFAIILWIVLFGAVLVWMVSYAFFGFCIADKATVGAREALRMSREVTRGSRWHLIVALMVASFVAMPVLFAIHKLVSMGSSETMMSMMSGGMSQRVALAQLLSVTVVAPFWMLYLVSIYRSLQTKK